jgi:hypothetical protein
MSREDLIARLRQLAFDIGYVTYPDGKTTHDIIREAADALSPAAEGEQVIPKDLREWCAAIWDDHLERAALEHTKGLGRASTIEQLAQLIEARAQQLAAEGRRTPIAPKPLDIIDGRLSCPKCGAKGDLIAAQCDAEAPQDVWECPACRHQWPFPPLTGAEG